MALVDEPDPPLIPVRMLNEFAYCPRLFYIEFVDGLFEDSADTASGTVEHARVDRALQRRRAPAVSACDEATLAGRTTRSV